MSMRRPRSTVGALGALGALGVGLAVVALALPTAAGAVRVRSAAAGVRASRAGTGAPARGPVGYVGPAVHSPLSAQSPLSNSGSQQFASRNWDGYITYLSSQGTDFREVKAKWVQPTVTCEAAQAWTVFWVGLDGWFNGTVEQGGTEAYCATAGGSPAYNVWWEMFPTNSIQTTFAINPGDKIVASVKYLDDSATFVIHVEDESNGQSLRELQHCAAGLVCQRSSADVITEDVGRFGNNTFFPLADYGTMGYRDALVKDMSGHHGTISAKAWLNGAVSESAGGVDYASVSPLSDEGADFTTTWLHQ